MVIVSYPIYNTDDICHKCDTALPALALGNLCTVVVVFYYDPLNNFLGISQNVFFFLPEEFHNFPGLQFFSESFAANLGFPGHFYPLDIQAFSLVEFSFTEVSKTLI